MSTFQIRSILFLSLALGMAAQAQNASPVALECDFDNAGVPEMVVRYRAGQALEWEHRSTYSDTTVRTSYQVLGQVKISEYDYESGNETSQEVAVFVGRDKNGHSTLILPLSAGADEVIQGEQKDEMTSGRMKCKAGPAWADLQGWMASSPQISKQDYYDSQDGQLAAVCRVESDAIANPTAFTHKVRAMRFSYGSLNVQFSATSRDLGSDSNFDDLVFGRDGLYVFRSGKSMAIRHETAKIPRLYFEPLTSINARGKRESRITYVEDLRNPAKSPLNLVCEERQAFDLFEQIAKEQRAMPKALPATPGTRAQINASLCGYEQWDAAQEIISKWRDLVMNIELPDQAMITMSSMGEKPGQCPTYRIKLSNEAGAQELKRILGESLDGLELEFEW